MKNPELIMTEMKNDIKKRIYEQVNTIGVTSTAAGIQLYLTELYKRDVDMSEITISLTELIKDGDIVIGEEGHTFDISLELHVKGI